MMSFHLSNNLLGIVNLMTFLLSIPILGAGIWFSKSGGATACGLTPDNAVIIIAVLIMIVSLIGFIGSCYRVTWLLWAYLVLMAIFILCGLGFTMAKFVVSSKGSGEALPGKGYKEYRLAHYSNWIQKIVNETENWNRIKDCMVETKGCASFSKKYQNDTVENFYKQPLNAIQSGCCKPSNDCGFTYRSPTNWTEEKGVYSNPDCRAWDNDPKVTCFNCQSCKAAVADNMMQIWKTQATIDFAFLFFLIILWCIGCRALANNLKDGAYDNQKWRP